MGFWDDLFTNSDPEWQLNKRKLELFDQSQRDEEAKGWASRVALPGLLGTQAQRPQLLGVTKFDPYGDQPMSADRMLPGGGMSLLSRGSGGQAMNPAPQAPLMDPSIMAGFKQIADGGYANQYKAAQAAMKPNYMDIANIGLVNTNGPGGKPETAIGIPAKPPEGFKVGATREIQRGSEKVTQEYDGRSWKDIANGPAFAPREPQAPQVQELFDEATGRPYKAERQPDGSWKRVGGISTPAKTFNNDQNKAAGFANTMTEAEATIGGIGSGNKDKGDFKAYDPTTTVESARGATNFSASPNYQKYKQAAMDWTLAVLRQESGANVPETEAAKYWKNYFPQYGDSADVIKQKAASRATKMRGVIGASGGAYESLRGKPSGATGGWGKVTQVSK